MHIIPCKKEYCFSKESLNGIFAELYGSSPIKNITGRLNLRELLVDDISAKFIYFRKCKEIYTNQINSVLSRCFFFVFN